MARDAIARQYDVKKNSIILTCEEGKGSYRPGLITFEPKKDRSLDLDKILESLTATRLSGGTSMGVDYFEITILGAVEIRDKEFAVVRLQDRTAIYADGRPRRQRPVGKAACRPRPRRESDEHHGPHPGLERPLSRGFESAGQRARDPNAAADRFQVMTERVVGQFRGAGFQPAWTTNGRLETCPTKLAN